MSTRTKAKPKNEEPEVKYPARLLPGLLAMALLTAVAAIVYNGASASFDERNRDPFGVARQESRFTAIKQMFPPTEKLGYFSDLPDTEWTGQASYLTAQYALAPRLLIDASSPNCPPFVIGNFSKQLEYATEGVQRGLVMQKDFGGGVVLYRKQVK